MLGKFYHEPDCYAENDSVGRAARFNSNDSVRFALHESFHSNSYCVFRRTEDDPARPRPAGEQRGRRLLLFCAATLQSRWPGDGELFGSKTLVKTAINANPNLEQRATLLIFTFGNRQDQIVVMGFAIIRRTQANLMRDRLMCALY